MGKWQRDKGANFEREIANIFKANGINARRGGFAQSQDASNEPDVIVEDLPGLWIECKRGAKTYPIGALKQAREAGGTETIPIAICKDDYDKITVTMEMDFFLVLLEHLIGKESGIPEAKNDNEPIQGTLDLK